MKERNDKYFHTLQLNIFALWTVTCKFIVRDKRIKSALSGFLNVFILEIRDRNKSIWGIDEDSLQTAKDNNALIKEVLGNVQPQPNII